MTSTGPRGLSLSQMSNGSGGSSNSGASLEGEYDFGDELNNNPSSPIPTANGGLARDMRDRTEAWWTVGEHLDAKNQVTHQSARFTLTGNRVFGNQRDELWDLSDSLLELYETIQRHEGGGGPQQLKRTRNAENANRTVDINDWLSKDISHGFVRVYAPDMINFLNSRLVPVTLSTTVQQVAHSLGLSMNGIHVQMNGDIIRRMDAYEHPLVIQNQYLAELGFDDINRIQEEGAKEELGYLIRFYSGKPMMDSTFSRNQLQAYLEIKKGGVLQNWIRRLCVLSGTRLLIYKDKYKRTHPTVVQLARGAVEEANFKSHDYCLRLTSTLGGERVIYLAFTTSSEYIRWFKKCKKATDKLPTSADLSNCHLEFLPENIFVNDQLAMLNLRHNILKERPIEEDIFVIGWLDDLSRFTRLRSLNLADNNLVTFPLAVCHIRTLVELNIASNKLEDIPPDVAELNNLQALHIHNNHLTSLPEEMTLLRKLFILVLAFNRFQSVPAVVAQMTNIRVSEMENIIMAGNRIEKIPADTLLEMKYVKKVDLRMNQLTFTNNETTKLTVLEHLTHLDVRDNRISELDVRALRMLEYLNCERNDMLVLRVNGTHLKNLFAAQNCIETLVINPKPEYLHQVNLSYNQLRSLPDWLSDCFFLQKLNVGYNLLAELPARIFIDAKKLKTIRADHNNLRTLPEEVDIMSVEEVHVHHNLISHLPDDFFVNLNKLRVFNGSSNRLTSLPPVNKNPDLNKIQELYLTANFLSDSAVRVVSGFPRLKVLNLAHNEIHNLHERDIGKLELLQDLNISGNQLRSLPKSLGELTKLNILRAHSNILGSLPDFHKATNLRVLDVGHNQLYNVSVTDLMASQLNLLDMSLNTQLKVDPKEFKSLKNQKSVCLVDATGQNRDFPVLKNRHSQTYSEDEGTDPNTPWKVGFSETSGIRNKLCIRTLRIPVFRGHNESLFGMFDGGHNDEVPNALKEKLPEILRAELSHAKTESKYMKYAMLTAHRSLKACGQKIGASTAVLHLRRLASAEKMNVFDLHMANTGDVEVVLCRHGEASVLTRKFVTQEDLTECERIQDSDGIITEDNKVNGVTKNTRMLGCAFLYPHIIPCPYTCEMSLRNDDEFLIIANRGLWKHVPYGQAVEEIYHIGNPVVAAKRLMDLAQGYGSKENISVLVVRLNTDRGPSLGRLKPPHRDMSVDDVQAAERHEMALRAHRLAQGLARREAARARDKNRAPGSHRESRQRGHDRVDFGDGTPNRVYSHSEQVIAGNRTAVGGVPPGHGVKDSEGSTDTLIANEENSSVNSQKWPAPPPPIVVPSYGVVSAQTNGHVDDSEILDKAVRDSSEKYDRLSRNLRDSFRRHHPSSSRSSSSSIVRPGSGSAQISASNSRTGPTSDIVHSQNDGTNNKVISPAASVRQSTKQSYTATDDRHSISPSASTENKHSITQFHEHSSKSTDPVTSSDSVLNRVESVWAQGSIQQRPPVKSEESLDGLEEPLEGSPDSSPRLSRVTTKLRDPTPSALDSSNEFPPPPPPFSHELESTSDLPLEGSPESSPHSSRSVTRELRPLPNQRFVKKNAAEEWEQLLQKRLSTELKDQELRQLSVGADIDGASSDISVVPPHPAEEVPAETSRPKQQAPPPPPKTTSYPQTVGPRQGQAMSSRLNVPDRRSQSLGRSQGRLVTQQGSEIKQGRVSQASGDGQLSNSKVRQSVPWFAAQTEANPAYSINPGVSDQEVIDMTTKSPPTTTAVNQGEKPAARPANVRSRIAMFENIQRDREGESRVASPRRRDPDRPRTTFFSPTRAEPGRPPPAVNVPPRRCLSPPPDLRMNSQTVKEGQPNLSKKSQSDGKGVTERTPNNRPSVIDQMNVVSSIKSPSSPPPPPTVKPVIISAGHQSKQTRRPHSVGPTLRQPYNNPGPLTAGSPRQLPQTPTVNMTPNPATQPRIPQGFHGSVESDLYTKVKRVKKAAPPVPVLPGGTGHEVGGPPTSVQSVAKETSASPSRGGRDSQIVEISHL